MSYNNFAKNRQIQITTGTTSNATITFADVSGISFPLMANTVYFFEFSIIWQSTNTGVGISFGINGPTSPTFVLVRTEIPTSLTAVTQGMARAYSTGTATGAIDTANANCFAKCYGFISNGSNTGNLTLQLKSSTTTSVSVRAGTVGRLFRLSPSN